MSLVIFDLDGTLVAHVGGAPASTPREQRLLPGVAEVCQRLRDAGDVLAVASYQADETLVKHGASLVGAEHYVLCHPHRLASGLYFQHPPCDKPAMLDDLMRRAAMSPDETIFVGNEASDWAAALATGVEFIWANDFFA